MLHEAELSARRAQRHEQGRFALLVGQLDAPRLEFEQRIDDVGRSL
jgi:hypothetical protein